MLLLLWVIVWYNYPYMISKPRQKAFLEEYSKTSNITQSAIKAGYSPIYADKLGKRIVATAIRGQALEIIERIDNKGRTKDETKQLLCDVIGINRELLSNTLKKIALNDKDYSSAIKILSPLAKEAIGLDITQQDSASVVVPVLNIVVDTPNIDNTAIQGDIVG